MSIAFDSCVFESVSSDRSRDVIKRNSHCDRTCAAGSTLLALLEISRANMRPLKGSKNWMVLGFLFGMGEWHLMSFNEYSGFFFHGKYQLSCFNGWSWRFQSCARSETDWSGLNQPPSECESRQLKQLTTRIFNRNSYHDYSYSAQVYHEGVGVLTPGIMLLWGSTISWSVTCLRWSVRSNQR